MHLFDPAPYTDESKPLPRAKPKALPMLKLRPPWVVARYAKKEPLAHLPFNRYTDKRDNAPMFTPECNHKVGLTILPVDGEPLVDVCRQCLVLARKRGIIMDLREVDNG